MAHCRTPVSFGLEELPMRVSVRRGALAILLPVLLAGCARWSEATVFVRSGSSAEHRKQVAQAYATEQNLLSLRSRLKQRFPATTDAQLQQLYLKSKITTGDDDTSAAVVVGVRGHSAQGNEFLLTAVELVDADVNGQDSR